jgi:hypothetical protein
MFNKEPKIEFFSTKKYLNDIEECRPKPLSSFLPEWWSQKRIDKEFKTVKDCPSFPQLFKNAYIIPMWSDLEVTINETGINTRFASDDFGCESHSGDQFLDFAPESVRKNTSIILKPDCPWGIITSPGYAVYQTESFYHFNENFKILPGIINTDKWHEVNQQMLITNEHKKFVIKRGDPFGMYIPFKRDKFSLKTRTANEKDIYKLDRARMEIFTKFKGGYANLIKDIYK